MAEHYKGLVDHRGRPIEKKLLTQEVAAATVGSVRSPHGGYPGDGLDPLRLAAILKEADQGEPLRYLELAETIEERDLHYLGVLGTRKRQVSQLDITVDAASDDAGDAETADLVRDWLMRDELQDELFDILDAVGKGVSYTEIIWDTSEGQWQPKLLERRDPRHFKPHRTDLVTPMMLGDDGQLEEQPPFKFINANFKAKSGLPMRSGIARIAAWAWMFKAFANRDWAIFIQTYGQPIRIGKYGPGASQAEKDTLFRAVANIAGDCAAIIPESMVIEFEQTASIGSSTGMYIERVNWLDQQVSKGVLGQTATTDAIAGGHAVGREHRQVQEDIERADAKQLSAIINRDLIQPWIMLEYGPDRPAPRVRIGRQEQKDVDQTVGAVERLVPLGLKVPVTAMRELLGLPEPKAGEEILMPRTEAKPGADGEDEDAVPLKDKGKGKDEQGEATLHAEEAPPNIDALVTRGTTLAAAAEAALMDALVEIVLENDAPADRELALAARWPGLPVDELKGMMTRAMVLAQLMGQADA